METNNNLPYAELKKFGIVNTENKFSSKLSKQEVDNFLSGSTLIAENATSRLTFKLAKDRSNLEVEVYNKDIVNHKELSSSELLEIASNNKALYKAMSDHGKIVGMGKTHFNDNPKNEITNFLEIENERGKTLFFGNDLEEKLKNFKIGDSIQVNNIGIEKTDIKATIDDEIKDITKYSNIFQIEALTEENKTVKSKLFDYDTATKSIVDLDTTKLEFDTINGIKLTPEQIRDLKRGKEINLEDDTDVQLSPKSKNVLGLTSNTKNLLLASIALDGGLSFLIIKGVSKLNRMRLDHKKQQETASFNNGLETMKKVLESRISQSPNDQSLKEKLKGISKEIVEANELMATKGVATKNVNSGTLIEKGEANYLHDPNNEKSYFVTLLDNDKNQKTIWGIDLKEKLADVPAFENIEVKYAGKKDVVVKVPVRDEKNTVVSFEEKTVKRNSFDIIENEKVKLSQTTIDQFKENSEKLNQIKAFLLSKSRLYPENKEIINSINIVDKYISSTSQQTRDDTKNLQVVDYDTFEDANTKKRKESQEFEENKKLRNLDQEEERTTFKGRSR